MKFICYKSVVLKKFAAVFLLCIFTLGITPKKTLHSLLANHTDNTCKSLEGNAQKLSKAGFNCLCDDLVAESSFIASSGFIISIPVQFYSASDSYFTSFISSPALISSLRGPPAKFLIAII